MIDFLLLKKNTLEKHLLSFRQLNESCLWTLWLSLCFVCAGFGPWWASLTFPFIFATLLCISLSAVYIRETRRFEWVDTAGIYLTPQPVLMGRYAVIVFKALVIFFPLALPMPDLFFAGFGWMLKVCYGIFAWLWLLLLVVKSQRIIWKLSLWRCILLSVTAMHAALLPVGIAGMSGFWSRQGPNLSQWILFHDVEFYLSSFVVLFGIPSLFFVIWHFMMFHFKGSRKPEGQRRRRLDISPVNLKTVKILILLILPLACWQGINHWNQKSVRKMLYEGDILGALDHLQHISSGLGTGIPYRADYYDLKRLIQFHQALLKQPVHLDHFSELSLSWWARHPRTKRLVAQLNVDRIQSAYLSPIEQLFISQIRLDVGGEFTKFVRENDFVDERVLDHLEQFKLILPESY